MKILFILPRYHTNYIEIFKTLLSKGHKVKLCVYNFGFIEDHKIIKPKIIQPSFFTNLINYFIKSKLNKFYLPNINKFNDFIEKFSPDIVIMRPYSKIFTTFFLMYKFFKKFELIFYHQTDKKKLEKFNLSYKFLKFFLLDKVLKLKSYSPIINRYDNLYYKKFYYLPFVTRINFKEKKITKKNKFLMIGKFLKKKNHEMFIEGIKFLDQKHKVEGMIIGEASTLEQKKEFNRLKKIIIKNKLENKITMIKNIDHKIIRNYFHRNDFFVLPTDHDPAPFSLLEAMASGCMVLCSSSCGTKNYINKSNGMIFQNNNQISLNQNMLKMIRNKKKFFKNTKKNRLHVNSILGKKNFEIYFKKLIKD